MHRKLSDHQSGQALAEYMVLIPVAIALMIFAGTLTRQLGTAFQTTADALNRGGLCNAKPSDKDKDEPRADTATLGPHTIALSSVVYDSDTNTTTIAYQVYSGGDPSISHWVLGIPRAVYDNAVDIPEDELPSWVDPDPRTGAIGLKFDKGYESSGGDGDGSNGDTGNNGNSGNNGNNGKGGKGGKNKLAVRGMTFSLRNYARPVAQDLDWIDGWDRRTVVMVFTGEYEFEDVAVTIKAGQEVYNATVSAPVRVTTGQDNNSSSEGCNI